MRLARLPVLAICSLLVLLGCSDSRPQEMPSGEPPSATPGGERSTPDSNAHLRLPDLTTTPPGQLFIRELLGGGAREIRFSTTLINVGAGPLELVGDFNSATQEAQATQIVQGVDGSEIEHPVGKLERDPAHGHYHLSDFFIFELWTFDASGRLAQMLTSTPKITFCLLDYVQADPAPANVAAAPGFIDCSWQNQGISEGWSETYDANLPGQQLDISEVPDGRYAARVRIDPDNLLLEEDKENNVLVFFVEISGSEIALLDTP